MEKINLLLHFSAIFVNGGIFPYHLGQDIYDFSVYPTLYPVAYLREEVIGLLIRVPLLRHVVEGGAYSGLQLRVGGTGRQHQPHAHRRRVLQERLAQLQWRTRRY